MKCQTCGTYVCICDTTFDDVDLNRIVDRHYESVEEIELINVEADKSLLQEGFYEEYGSIVKSN